jgi:hypothetical protein
MEYITTANVLVWFLMALGVFLMFVSYWLAAAALVPAHVARCAEKFGRPVVTTGLGLLVVAIPIGLGVVVLNAAPAALKWTGVFLIGVPLFSGLVGSAGLAYRIGLGLPVPGDDERPWRAVGRGGVVLALTFLLPVLGQLLVIPLVLAAGAGAGFWAWLSARRRKPAEVLPEAAVVVAAPAEVVSAGVSES